MPVIQAMAATAGSMGVQKAGNAVFGGNAAPANMAPPPSGPGGMNAAGSPAMSILGGLQQQMQQEEAMRQQAIKQLLMQFTQGMAPPQGPQQPIQMES